MNDPAFPGVDDPPNGTNSASPANVTDANAFQEVSQGDVHLITPDQIPVDRPPSDILEDLAEQPETIEFDSYFLETSSVVIDVFPFGNPGAAIPGMPPGSSFYEPSQATQGDSIWAPFQSKRDWDMARWVKTHSTTSSAVAELLAMPEVCRLVFSPDYVSK